MKSKRNPKSVNTIALYCHAVLIYTKHYMKTETPEKALQNTKANSVDKFIDFLLETKNYTPKSVRLMFYGLKYWLETNDRQIPKNIQLPKSSITKTFDRSPTKAELEKLLTFTDIRGKALIEIATSSGLRLDTILGLKWKDITFNEDHTTITIEPEEGRKTSKPFFTFITPEATKVLKEYREWLTRRGFNTTPESYVIISLATPNVKLTSNTMQMFWNRLLKQAGLTEKSHKYYVLHFHTLRKYFKTQCTNADIRREYTEFWMGHRGTYLDDSYFRATVNDHVRQYAKAIPYLSITEAQKEMSKLDLAKQTALTALRTQLSPDSYRTLETLILQAKSTEVINETIDKYRSERTQLEPIKRANESDCQKIVCESELEDYFKRGFHYVATLPSGKILVSNE